MKRILVAGGAGFIGAHLCRVLVGLGHHVTAIDNFLTGSRDNLSDLLTKKNFQLIEHDLLKTFTGEYQEIYNLACPASPPHYQERPVQTTLTNVIGACNMLELAMKNNARILQASTSEVYGNPEVHPQPESYFGNVNPIGPRACYDEGKRCAETLFFDYHREHNVDIKVVRIFNTYGPLMHRDDGRVVSNFICQALGGKPLTVYGDGSQTRSFCYVDDMVDGLTRMMTSNVTGPINLGNPEEFTIQELAEMVLEMTGSKSAVTSQPLPQDDPLQRRPDITLAKKVLGWEPKIPLRRGLEKTIGYFRQQLKAA